MSETQSITKAAPTDAEKIVAAIETLHGDEGTIIEIQEDDPNGSGEPGEKWGVEIVADWTGRLRQIVYGHTLLEAMEGAVWLREQAMKRRGQ